MLWTREVVRERLAEAAYTIKRLPRPVNGRPKPLRAVWPDMAQDWLAYGDVRSREPWIKPSGAAIDRLEEVLHWLFWLERDQRLILWARASGWTWKRIEALDDAERNGRGRSERWLRQVAGDGEERIVRKLNGQAPRLTVSQVLEDAARR